MKEAETVGVVVFALSGSVDERKVLFLRRAGGTYGGQWWPIGGTCKEGESPLGTAVRELGEETGLTPSAIYAFGEDIPHADRRSRIEAFVAYVEDTEAVSLNYEHSEYRWLSSEEALQIVLEPRHIIRLRDHFMRSVPTAAPLA